MKAEFVAGAIASACLIFLMFVFLILGANLTDNSNARSCLNKGRVVLDKTIFSCERIGPEVSP